MKYHTELWTLADLAKSYDRGDLNLNPPYQRNDIWLNPAKKKLIDSIQKEYPLPVFFLHSKGDKKYDVVDGQQRIRAIMGYMKGLFKDLDKKLYSQIETSSFNIYEIVITIIDSSVSEAILSDFYYRVNKYGIKLNRPEILKAQYQNTNFQDLITNLTDLEEFQELGLFSENNLTRMTDVEFTSELLGLIEFGIQEKKKSPNELYKNDILQGKAEILYSSFLEILEILKNLNEIYPINQTRYKQKNDFYTLWGFINDNLEIEISLFIYFYKILILIGNSISPSNEESISMSTYAYHCVTQSNSKNARLARLDFFNKLFLNTTDQPNETQKDILNYYQLSEVDVIKLNGFLTVDGIKIQNIVGIPQLFNEGE